MKNYCTQNNGDCETCSLVNYGMDCKNQPLKKAQTTQRNVVSLYKQSRKQGYKKDTKIISISMGNLGILINYAEGIGVRDICDKHSKILQLAKQKAAKLRYHIMARSILPSDDIIYDSRYADVTEIGDWEI